jgi:hypothetical protein
VTPTTTVETSIWIRASSRPSAHASIEVDSILLFPIILGQGSNGTTGSGVDEGGEGLNEHPIWIVGSSEC